MNGKSELPEGWANAFLSEIIIHALGGEWGKDIQTENTNENALVKVIRGTEFKNWEKDRDKTAALRLIKKNSLFKRNLKCGDIVVEISGGGPEQPVGRSLIIDQETLKNSKYPLICSNFCRQIRINPEIDSSFVNYCLKYAYSKGDFIRFQSQSINIRNLNFNDFVNNTPIPLPPLAEQRRIVGAVEALLTQVNASRERLDRVPGLLKAFRQAVLAAACSGRLTEGWREENFEKSISQIEIDQNDTIINPKIPATWQITQLFKLTDLTSGFAFKKSEYSQNGIRLLQIANVSFGKIIWDDLAYLPHNYLEKYPNLCLKPGDILMALNRPILGNNLKIGILKNSDTPAILYQRVGRFDVFNQDLKPYLYLFLNSPFFILNLQKDLQGVDQPFIRKPKLLNISVPLPPLPEQHEIVRRVESLFALADSIEQRVATGKERADRLTQTILAKAFRGELVPTEAELAKKERREYEPASVLLKRIREEKEKDNAKVKKRSRQKKDLSK